MSAGQVTVGVDIGGTFTDVVVVDGNGGVRVAKAASTPPDYGRGVLDGLAKLGVEIDKIDRFAHGTTTAINAILTKSGAETGLLTTAGFRDVLEIRRGDRAEMYNYWWRASEPLVPRHNRLEVRERIRFDGEILTPISEEDVLRAIAVFKRRGITSIAVCFLNSFVNGENERRAAAMIREHWPEVYVCASVDIAPELLEFERTSTTVANAYVGPIVDGYLGALDAELRNGGLRQELLIMASSGSVMTMSTALEVPIATAMSGIAAGAMAGAALARTLDRPDLITLDVGGTSSDIALISDFKPRLTTEWFIEFGIPIRLPAIDIHTIGAGGGSIARVDVGGALHVGPGSAGAQPGPACYGRGGEQPTTTDAQVILGRLDLPGWHDLYGWTLDPSAAEAAIRRSVAEPLELSVVEAAEAILDVTVNNLVEAIRLVTIERGYDPRTFVLAAFGGAGPMYAVDVARSLEIPEVLIPAAPGVTSALGLLQVDLAVRAQRSVLLPEDALDSERIGRLFSEMEAEVRDKFARSGYRQVSIRRQVDVRYFGQSRYLTVDAPPGAWTDDTTRSVIVAFNIAHKREHGYVMPPDITQIEFSNLRVVGEVAVEQARIGFHGRAGGVPRTRRAYFKDVGFSNVSVYARDELERGSEVVGPAIIEQTDSALILPPASQAVVLPSGDILIQV
jgi:N-methylhydantoinase A